MITQLKLAGVLDGLAGFIFGQCRACSPGETYGSLTLEEVLQDHIRPLAFPPGAVPGLVISNRCGRCPSVAQWP